MPLAPKRTAREQETVTAMKFVGDAEDDDALVSVETHVINQKNKGVKWS